MADEDIVKLARRIRREAAGTPEREVWLQRIREQVRSGTYEVDPEQLADTLIDRLFTPPPDQRNENEV
jgi:anti-sigma28 factor (negative regulator of flagellin synthesis)